MYGLGRCENVDCIQKGCERLNESGTLYDFAKICGESFKWFVGKDKIKTELVEEINE